MDKVNKKGQVTIFIVLGIIILIAIALMLYLQGAILKKPLETEKLEQQPQFRGQTELKNYVNQCLQDVALQGLEIIRLQGGYINIPNDVETFTVKDKENKQIKIVDGSKKVVVDPSGIGNDVPYWITKDSLAVPSMTLIKSQLEEYINNEVNKCVNDFKPFRDQGFSINYGNIDSKVKIGNAVIITLSFPIEASKGTVVTQIDEFIYTIPINLQLVIDMASGIVGFESNQKFAEAFTKDLISLYSGVDEKRLPPYFYAVSNLDCDSVGWERRGVENLFKAILEKNTKHLHIENTKFNRTLLEDPETAGTYSSFVYEFFNKQFPEVSIDFSYKLEWELNEFDIQPNNGDAILPSRVAHNIPFVGTLCVFEYESKYTIDAPLLVEIEDSLSAVIDPKLPAYYDQKGYRFQFFIDSHLCGNQERVCNEEVVIANFTDAIENLGIRRLPETFFCDEDQKISEEISITYRDENAIPISDVDLYYRCGSYINNCYMGRSDENGLISTKFPLCINGQLYSSKKDYADFSKTFTTYNAPVSSLSVLLEKITDVKVKVKKIDVIQYVKEYFEEEGMVNGSNLIKDLHPEENALVTAQGPNFVFYLSPDLTNSTIKLSSGSYDVSIAINGNVTVSETVLGLPSVISGMFSMGRTDFIWNIISSEITDSITFFGLSEYDKSRFNNRATVISDSIIRDDGTLKAELLYQCNRTFDPILNKFECNFNDCQFVSASGTIFQDYQTDTNTCEKANAVTIQKSEYLDFVKPKFN